MVQKTNDECDLQQAVDRILYPLINATFDGRGEYLTAVRTTTAGVVKTSTYNHHAAACVRYIHACPHYVAIPDAHPTYIHTYPGSSGDCLVWPMLHHALLLPLCEYSVTPSFISDVKYSIPSICISREREYGIYEAQKANGGDRYPGYSWHSSSARVTQSLVCDIPGYVTVVVLE